MSWLAPTPDETSFVEALDRDDERVRLAMLLAPAALIDTALLRNMRVHFLPRSNAGLESALWFSDIVISRSVRAIAFAPGVARLLTDALNEADEPPAEFAAVVAFIDRQKAGWSRETRLEQALRLAARSGDTASIRAGMQSIVAWFEHAEDDQERNEILRWARGTVPTLIRPEWAIEEAGWIIQLAGIVLGDQTGALAVGSGNAKLMPSWLLPRRADSRAKELGLIVRPGQLQFVEPTQSVHTPLPVGPGMPALLGIRYDGSTDIYWERVWVGQVLPIPPGTHHLELHTIAGGSYDLDIAPNVVDGAQTTPFQRPAEPSGQKRIRLLHLPQESRIADALFRRLKDQGYAVELVETPRDSAGGMPRVPIDVAQDVPTVRLWSQQAAKLFADAPREDGWQGVVARVDEAPLPPGMQEIRAVDLFDDGDAISDSGLQTLLETLEDARHRPEIWLIGSIVIEEQVNAFKRLLGERGFDCHVSDSANAMDIPSTMGTADAAFFLHSLDLPVKGMDYEDFARRASDAGLPLFHVPLDPEVEATLRGTNSTEIFFSHSNDDIARVAPIVAALEAEGWSVFSGQKRLPGADWDQQIRENLDRAKCVIVAWSHASISSFYVNDQAREALKRRRLLPLRLDEVEPPFGFHDIQTIDLTSWSGETSSREWRQLRAAVEHFVPHRSVLTLEQLAQLTPDSLRELIDTVGYREVSGAVPEDDGLESSPYATPGVYVNEVSATEPALALLVDEGVDAFADEVQNRLREAGITVIRRRSSEDLFPFDIKGAFWLAQNLRDLSENTKEGSDQWTGVAADDFPDQDFERRLRVIPPGRNTVQKPELLAINFSDPRDDKTLPWLHLIAAGHAMLNYPEDAPEFDARTVLKRSLDVARDELGLDALIAEIHRPGTPPERRLEIGELLINGPRWLPGVIGRYASGRDMDQSQRVDPRPGAGTMDRLPDIDWVQIPDGPFLYGEEKQTIELPTFFIARYPITNGQYQAFVDDGGYSNKAPWWEDLAIRIANPEASDWSQSNRPRGSLSWFEAMAFCRWFSNRLGYEVRLPTELEWEKAARGDDGRQYPWGNRYREGFANINEKQAKAGQSYLQQTVAVGLFPHAASPHGIDDMAGNVWEWCSNKYKDPTQIDPGGEATRALRGGSWDSGPEFVRTTTRSGGRPGARYPFIGFRLACSELWRLQP